MPNNIILIGYRCSGKSSVARAISKKLGWKVISTDEEITKKTGPIPEYVKKNGWDAFREREQEIISSIDAKNTVIDCGGGTVMHKCMERLCKQGKVFLLNTPLCTIRERLKTCKDRPSLSGNASPADEAEKVLSERQPLYLKLADHNIETKDKSVEEIAESVISLMNVSPANEPNQELRLVEVVAEETTEDVLDAIEKSVTCMIEIRIDYIKDISKENLKRIINKKTEAHKKAIITNRPRNEGGEFNGTEKERIGLLREAIELGADFVDIELSAGKKEVARLVKNKKGSQVICSYHDFDSFPNDPNKIYEKLIHTNSDIVKMACMGNSFSDNLRMLSLIEKAKQDGKKMIGIVMGRHGKVSRVLSGMAGSFITSYVPTNNNITAPGQMTKEEIKKAYGLIT